MGNLFYVQHAFTTGEISPDVQNRTDLEKYHSALLKAQNAIIRPYGSVVRRNGSEFLGETKYRDKKCRLYTFQHEIPYLLEIGHLYIRIWKNGKYTGTELKTPYEEEILDDLRFNQSADTLFICSGKYSVRTLQLYANEEWKFKPYALTVPPFEPMNDVPSHKLAVSGKTLTSTKDFFTDEMVGMVVQLKHNMPAKEYMDKGEWVISDYDPSYPEEEQDADYIYEPLDIGNYGSDTDIEWKIKTSGHWTGHIYLKKKYNTEDTDYQEYRHYRSNDDYNVNETGTIERGCELKIETDASSGLHLDLTIRPYTVFGMVVIDKVVNKRTAQVTILKPLGKSTGTSEWQISSWGKLYGYPRTCTFFQDRLVFGGSRAFPYKIWMSRTGDYPNFDVEKVGGTVTDDSAMTLSLISRSAFSIQHMVSAQDLVVLTDGNEWIVDGSESVKPSKVVPRAQTMHGCSQCEPQYIGNRIIYVQRRNSSVRDMGYTYESDNYNGTDLSLLAKHLVHEKNLVAGTFCQEPDSILYYVRGDGVIVCLTIIKEQEVYGWSHFVTDGTYESVATVPSGNEDNLYTVVKRNVDGKTVKFIERLKSPASTDRLSDYVLMDSSITITSEPKNVFNVNHLKGCKVQVIADGKRVEDTTVSEDGTITLTHSASNVQVGLAYQTVITFPQVALDLKDGTLQGRTYRQNSAVIRVRNSRGGKIGVIQGDGMNYFSDATLIENMHTGDINANVPSQGVGFDTNASLCIVHEEPYPFNLLSIVRDVTIGGGAIARYNNKSL